MDRMRISVTPLGKSMVRDLKAMRPIIDLEPAYQREGGVWTTRRQAGLIDTILNRLDVPKIYFAEPSARKINAHGMPFQYEVVDGQQRLRAIFAFLDNKLALDRDFILFENTGLPEPEQVAIPECATFQTLFDDPNLRFLAERFLSHLLTIEFISANSGDLVNELFMRLNESSSLNAAEKRNAISGQTRDSSEALSQHEFWVFKSPIKNARYKYRELSSRFLSIEHQYHTSPEKPLSDVKAPRLFRLFQATSGSQRPSNVEPISDEDMRTYETTVCHNLDRMVGVFRDNDHLLSSIGTVTVLYLLMRNHEDIPPEWRDHIALFERARRAVDQAGDDSWELNTQQSSTIDLMRRYNSKVQSSGDGSALTERKNILHSFVTQEPLRRAALQLIEEVF